MATVFTPGKVLSRGDLDLFLTNAQSNPINAAEIVYAIFYVDPNTHLEVLIGPAARTPANPSVGEYYAALMVPPTAVSGQYRIRWTLRQFSNSPQQTVVQEFTVQADAQAVVTQYSAAVTEMIWNLRVLLRDQNPDKFYRFRPPMHEQYINQFNRIFGQVWEDAELYLYLQLALDSYNEKPPFTGDTYRNLDQLARMVPAWRTAIYWGAIIHACFALQANWVADEFDYSIGGVSLSLEKSSKYDTLRGNAETAFDKSVEAKARTVKFIRGLQQPKYGIGIRSSFGPAVGKSVLSPRNFL